MQSLLRSDGTSDSPVIHIFIICYIAQSFYLFHYFIFFICHIAQFFLFVPLFHLFYLLYCFICKNYTDHSRNDINHDVIDE